MKRIIALCTGLSALLALGCDGDLRRSSYCYSAAETACKLQKACTSSTNVEQCTDLQNEICVNSWNGAEMADATKAAINGCTKILAEASAGFKVCLSSSTITSLCATSTSGGDNSCSYSYDGTCDEGTYCSVGTDSYDCDSAPVGDNSCTYSYDGECDEGTYCSAGTDSYDCDSAPVEDNSCTYSYDGECDEGTYCEYGTDSYDCDT